MGSADQSAAPHDPVWLKGRGLGPVLKWSVGTDGPLSCLSLSRESGDLYAGDRTGGIYRIDRTGHIAGLTRVAPFAVDIDWSDDGSQGALIAGEDQIIRLDHSLKVIHKLSLPDVCLAVAISPYGNHLAVALADGLTLIYNERSKKIAQFETIRPLSFLNFCSTEALLFGAAEHGLLCCHNLAGAEVWQQRNWANVGKLCMTGEGDLLYAASFAQGVQVYDGDGASVGSYLLEGTVHRADVSFEPERVIASTIERSLFWLDADGDQLWSTTLDDNVIDVACDPLGEYALIGLAEKGIHRLDWAGK
ncbi:WD40 repeat domain-containing protein [Planctomicrobium piriforme]|uniref:WD40 repeat domain-containing protein n=1 Tax=Planctomicrobium piriforme TaxID=1576369 RepID=A0A1I3M141_9PLAN|nr:WD40 repeat domain-containing protein [Planctomicrobium piriforme]SFI90693.1 hypothetical protein SAMN05421753_113127 [Planctomicrobium piriforme]